MPACAAPVGLSVAARGERFCRDGAATAAHAPGGHAERAAARGGVGATRKYGVRIRVQAAGRVGIDLSDGTRKGDRRAPPSERRVTTPTREPTR